MCHKVVFVFVAELWVYLFAAHPGQMSSSEAAWAGVWKDQDILVSAGRWNGALQRPGVLLRQEASKRLVMWDFLQIPRKQV